MRAAADLLADAGLYFKHHPRRRGRRAIEAFYSAAFATNPGATAHLISNLKVELDDDTIVYTCRYQRVCLNDPMNPRLLGIGHYSGRLARSGPGIRWLEHHVTTCERDPSATDWPDGVSD